MNHLHICKICEKEFIGGADFERHMELVHFNSDTLQTEKEFEKFNRIEKDNTRQDFIKRYLLRKRYDV